MSEALIVRPRLAFENEFGQHRNWWVRDSRIAGNPISVLLYLLSHDPKRMPTQTDARRDLALGKDAWVSAKRRLLETGFILEVRDRYPAGFKDSAGRPKGGQKRFRLFLQDPPEGHHVAESTAIIELDEPYEEFLEANSESHVGFSALAGKTPDQNHCGKSAVGGSPTAENPQSADNPQSFKEEKTRFGLVGSLENSDQPTNQTTREREVDLGLAALHPALKLTYAQLAREVNGRVDLTKVDLVRAVNETVVRAATRGERVSNPAAYAAAVIVRSPEQWPIAAEAPIAFEIASSHHHLPEWRPKNSCVLDQHWWGSERLPETERGHCEECGVARRTVDAAYAALEAELLAVGGDR